jgi:hypothetical protein
MFLYKYKDTDKGNFMGINNVASNFLNISAQKNNLAGLGGFTFAGTNNGAQPKTAVGNTTYLSAQTSGLMGETSFMRAEGGRPDRTVGENLKLIA